MQHDIENYLLELQKTICHSLSEIDGKTFCQDEWVRSGGGGGKTCVLQEGQVFEKAGVNFSHVYGEALPLAATAHRLGIVKGKFEAMGVSVVIHPRNPYVPTTHFNTRFIMVIQEEAPPVWWFGGGFDLTPYYGFEEDCIYWHQMAQKACKDFGEDKYLTYKQWCDDYFFLKHRNEARGIGGLFYDDLNIPDFEYCFAFAKSIGEYFLKAYIPIVEKRKDLPYVERERAFQCYRRGRYAEFNLIYDRGTLFGLQSGGRTESILMSLPPQVAWCYDWQPQKGSAEEKLTAYFLQPRMWINNKAKFF